MTYNIRYDNPNDGENKWVYRRDNIKEIINLYSPDILGIQEGLFNQIDYLDTALTDFSFVGVGRDDGDKKGEYSAIFYKKDRLKVLKHKTIWLSETPDTVSVGWDAVLPRICTYALFEIKESGNKIWVFNTHFDHIGKLARINSSELILNLIKNVNTKEYPVILTGDFNSEPESEVISVLSKYLANTKTICLTVPKGPDATFNSFNFGANHNKQIDYIFTSKSNVRVNKYLVIDTAYNRHYPSDHFPVLVELKIIKTKRD